MWAIDYLVRQGDIKRAFAIHALNRLTINEPDLEGWFHFDELLLLAVGTRDEAHLEHLFVHTDHHLSDLSDTPMRMWALRKAGLSFDTGEASV